MYLNCMIDVIILAQAVLQIFCWQDCFKLHEMTKSEKENNSVK